MRNKIPILAKRMLAFVLTIMVLLSVLAINVSAGDSAFMETLINTEKYVYVANFTSDTKNKANKYAYKYMNMAYVMNDACGFASGDGLNSATSQKNPNYCFRLNAENYGGNYSYSKKNNTGSLANSDSNLNMFLLLEGYVNSGGNLITDDNSISDAATAKEKNVMKQKKSKTTSPLSYPGYYTETVTSEQSEYAQSTLISLVAGLNGILSTVNDGKRFTSVTELVNKSILIRPADEKNVTILSPQVNPGNGDYQGYVIFYADLTTANGTGALVKETSAGQANRILSDMGQTVTYNANVSSAAFLNSNKLPRASIENGLYCYIFPIVSVSGNTYTLNANSASMFVYAMPKGFTPIYDSQGVLFSPVMFTQTGGEAYDYTENQGDVPWVSVHMLSMYANLVYKQYGQSVSTYVEPEVNIFSKMISGIFNGILWVIRSVLGLSEIDTLVFNLGSRGSASYNFGLMSENWWNVVLQYQLVFQAIAWVILVCGFIKTLIDLNLSTINPQKRSHLYDTIQKFIVVGIGLVILIPCVQFLLECNDTLVELFASQVETSSLNMPQVNNVLVQFIVGMCWITILLYINFIYIMRSITVALLIASGPFFISTVAFSHGGRSSLFVSWAKELLANIFVQSVHAFVLSFLVQLLVSGTFLETFAIAISIIPITEMFRGLIFAGAGGSTSQLANTATSATTKMGTGALRGVTGGVAKAIGGGDGGNGGGPGGGGSGGPGGGSGGSRQSDTRSIMDQRKSAKLERIAQGTSAGGRIKHASEQRTGKEGGSMLAKIGGTAVDIAGLAGMSAVTGMEAFGDFTEALSDLQLKGDTSGIGRAVEKHTSGGIQSAATTGASIAKAHQHKKNRQKTSSSDFAVSTSNANQMGGATLGAETTDKGQNRNGGKIKTSDTNETQTVYAPIDNSSARTQDISDASGDQISGALNHFESGTNQKQSRVLTKTDSGEYREGTRYSYTDENGANREFFVSDTAMNRSIPYRQTSGAAPVQGAPMASYSEGKQISKADDVRSAMAQQNGGVAVGRFDGYTDGNGRSIGTVREYEGKMYADFGRTQADAAHILQTHINEQMESKNGAVFTQKADEFANKMASGAQYDTAANTYDLREDTSSAGYTNAALTSAVGIEKSPGTYEFGGKTFVTGLSQSEAKDILSGRGISGVSYNAGQNANDGSVSYHQHTPPAHNQTFVGAQTIGNRTVAKFDAGIGSANGPSWKSDGSGGGQMTFSNKQAAMTYFQKHGALQMSDRIAAGGQSTAIHDFRGLSENGPYTVTFRGKDMMANGMRMEQHSDGKSLMVSTTDARVADPFAVDSDMSTTNLDNQPDVDKIMDDTQPNEPPEQEN